MKLLQLIFEQTNESRTSILFDDAATRVIPFAITHKIKNPEVLSQNIKSDLEKFKRTGKINSFPQPPSDKELIGYVGYGWRPMWDILQDIKSSRIPKVYALFIDSDIEYEQPDDRGSTVRKPGWSFTDQQKLDHYNVKHGMTGGDTLGRISAEYRKITGKEGIKPDNINYYLPYGIGLVDYLVQNKDVGDKIENIIVGNSSNSAADYFVGQLKRVYGSKVRRITPGILKSTGYVI